LPAIGAMLLAVILDRDFDVLPTHVEVCNRVAEFIQDWDLSLRPRQAGLDQDDS